MVGRWPADWRSCLTLIAGVFHSPPGELEEMDIDQLTFWLERAEEWVQWQQKSSR